MLLGVNAVCPTDCKIPPAYKLPGVALGFAHRILACFLTMICLQEVFLYARKFPRILVSSVFLFTIVIPIIRANESNRLFY